MTKSNPKEHKTSPKAPKVPPKAPKQGYRGFLILFAVALALIAVGYFQLRAAPQVPEAPAPEIITPEAPAASAPALDSQPTQSDGCPLYNSDTPQLFNFQLLHRDQSENTQLLYDLIYRCDCGAECPAGCGYNYTDLTGSASVPIIRFSDSDAMDLRIQGQVRDTFTLKCTQSQTVIYLTDEECAFSYGCYFFDTLVAERLSYEALNSFTCDFITRSCDRIAIAE